MVRSKNSGPYNVTLDALFSDPAIYNLVKRSNLLTCAAIAKWYHLLEEETVWCGLYDTAMAFKVTITRKRADKMLPSGGFMEIDVHGS